MADEEVKEQLELKKADYLQEPFEEGFNIKTILAAFFIGIVMMPGTIYLGLMIGAGIGGAAQWVTLILFMEITKRSLTKMTKQEIYIIYCLAGSLIAPGLVLGAATLTLQGGAFSELIWNQYLAGSANAVAWGLKVPVWVVPPAGSEALIQRTFLSKVWILPIVLIIIHHILFRLNFFGLGYIMFRLTSDVEKLDFPMAAVAAEGATALAESSSKTETWRWKVFSISSMIGVVFGVFYILIPAVTGTMMTKPFMLLPIPFVDATDKIGVFWPSSMLGFATDLGVFLAGFIVPFWVVVGTFVGSVGCKTILNPILYKYGIIKSWLPGMTAIPTYVTTHMDIWLSVSIGMAALVALMGIWKVITMLIAKGGRTSLRKLPEGRGDVAIWKAAVVFIISTTLYVILCHILVPGFPILLFILFGFILTPLLSYIAARMFGITGVADQISFPYLKEGIFILSGYKGVNIWFAPVPFYNQGWTSQKFKELELTRTKFGSWVKAEFLALGVMLIFSFIFWHLIWRMGGIPSASYPFVNRMWPMESTFKCLWATSTLPGGPKWMLQAIKPGFIFWGGGVSLVLYAVLSFFKFPVSFFYGIVAGVSGFPHWTIPMFFGALLSRFFFEKKIGKETWRKYTPIILAGYGCGMGLVGMASIAIALIAQAVTALVF